MTDPRQVAGLEYLRAVVAGNAPQSPMASTIGIALTEVSEGVAVFRGAPDGRFLNPLGVVHGGWYGTILDSALGCAAQTTLPLDKIYTALEYKVNLARALSPGTLVESRAEVQHSGRSTVVARAELRGLDDGRLYATGSTTCIILDAPG